MIRSAILALSLLPALGLADRLIDIPTARKLTYKTIRYELRFEPGQFGRREALIDAGIGTSFEAEVRSNFRPSPHSLNTFDLEYNYIAPFPGLTPGIGFGVQDANNETQEGRRYYAVTTYRVPCDTLNGDFPADVSLGVFAGRKVTPFVGVLVPFSKEFHLLAEHDGTYLAAGFEYSPFPSLNLRAVTRNEKPLIGCQWTTRW